MWFYPIDHEATLGYFAELNTLLKTLAWPVTTLIVLWFFRDAIAKLADRIEQVDGGGTSIKFTRGLKEAATAVERIPDAEVPPTEPPPTPVLPREAVLEAWIAVEQDLRDLYFAAYKEAPLGPSMQLALRLRKTQTIDADTYVALKQLVELRNAAAHAATFTISNSVAKEYQDLTNRVRGVLKNLRVRF